MEVVEGSRVNRGGGGGVPAGVEISDRAPGSVQERRNLGRKEGRKLGGEEVEHVGFEEDEHCRHSCARFFPIGRHFG